MHSQAGRHTPLPRERHRGPVPLVAILALSAGQFGQSTALAVTPESPEVQKLVYSGLDYLAHNAGDQRLGAKCLVGLAFLKAERREHPRVKDALEACRAELTANSDDVVLDTYSNGLAPIFLCELSPKQHAKEIQWFLDRMRRRQMKHGGWGYPGATTGDTSQTQYSTLCYWEAHRNGFAIDPASIENVADWLMRTQDPAGCWGYQGQLAPTRDTLVRQSETTLSMLAAGLGSTYVCADLLNAVPRARGGEPSTGTAAADPDADLPAALRRVQHGQDQPQPAPPIQAQRTDVKRLLVTIDRANDWMAKNYAVSMGAKSFYYLYALERYKSFSELFAGQWQEEPQWYNDGYEFLAKDQDANGSWTGYCGATCDTAFSILFLLRSTKKSLRARLGEGTLLGGRGLPRNLARAKLRNGQVVVDQVRTKVGELLSMVDEDNEAQLDELARDPTQLVVDAVDANGARRLQQLARGGEPQVRLLAVRVLGRTGNLDYVPTLLYALTDPDRRVVLEARDALRFISRNLQGYGPPDDFTDAQRFEAVVAWKNWYRSLRPTAILE